MNKLKFFRKETPDVTRFRKLHNLRRPAIPAPVDEDINHFYIKFKEGDSCSVEIGNS